MRQVTRRGVLRWGLAVGIGSLAGCGESTDTPTETATETPTVTATPTTEPEPTVTEAEFRSGSGSCGDTPSADITRTADGIRVTGTVVAPTPCYDAVLGGYTAVDRVARFRIGVSEKPGTSACVQCLAAVPFELTATFARGSFDAVVIELGGTEPETFHKELS